MKLLLDTCCIIWAVSQPSVLSQKASALLTADESEIEEAYSLPDTFHADPADRIITASARLNNCTILTADQKILAYPHVNSIW